MIERFKIADRTEEIVLHFNGSGAVQDATIERDGKRLVSVIDALREADRRRFLFREIAEETAMEEARASVSLALGTPIPVQREEDWVP